MSSLNLKSIWIPIEILTDDKLSDKEKTNTNQIGISVFIFTSYNIFHL